MSYPEFSEWPRIPTRDAPEADFDASMYAVFRHLADTHRDELIALGQFLQTGSTVLDGTLNDTTIGLNVPAAAQFTTVTASNWSGTVFAGGQGAALETGQNANGNYVRFAGGVQICGIADFAAGAASTVWTFPAVFSAAPAVNGTVISTGARVVTASPVNTTSATLRSWNFTPELSAESVSLIAIGRWS